MTHLVKIKLEILILQISMQYNKKYYSTIKNINNVKSYTCVVCFKILFQKLISAEIIQYDPTSHA